MRVFKLFSCVVVKRSSVGDYFKENQRTLIFDEEFVEFVTAAASLHSFFTNITFLLTRACTRTRNTKHKTNARINVSNSEIERLRGDHQTAALG